MLRLTVVIQWFATFCEADPTLNNIERNIPKMEFNDIGDDVVQRHSPVRARSLSSASRNVLCRHWPPQFAQSVGLQL